jgi:hypothetical protein
MLRICRALDAVAFGRRRSCEIAFSGSFPVSVMDAMFLDKEWALKSGQSFRESNCVNPDDAAALRLSAPSTIDLRAYCLVTTVPKWRLRHCPDAGR